MQLADPRVQTTDLPISGQFALPPEIQLPGFTQDTNTTLQGESPVFV